MTRGLRRQAPALTLACLALFVALGGTVYAAKKLDGHAIKPKSLPGNRLAPGSVPGNRLKPGAILGNRLAPGSITGTQIDAATLGQVPAAVHADSADTARDAQTALIAASAEDAKRVNGYEAGCGTGTRPFAGACWEVDSGETARTAPEAAAACASRGGELPEALPLAAFSKQPGIGLAPEDEWTGDVSSYTDVNSYSVVTVSSTGQIKSTGSTNTKRFRCVLPLVR
jgi:hypothetical protein